jgi:hypothetical protein
MRFSLGGPLKHRTPLLLLICFSFCLASCHSNSNQASNIQGDDASPGQSAEADAREPYQMELIVDTVKARKDPKGGWFGPKLQDVYPQGHDTPIPFCASGPSIPTQKLVTIFYRQSKSGPDRSACRLAVAVVEGDGTWKNGQAFTTAQLSAMRQQEEHFHPQLFVPINMAPGSMDFSWRRPKPIGPACPDPSGAPSDVARRYKGQACSLVVMYPNTSLGYVMFVNWKVTGIDDAVGADSSGPAPSPRDVVQKISAEYGASYVLSR